jgi:hypothetical protein
MKVSGGTTAADLRPPITMGTNLLAVVRRVVALTRMRTTYLGLPLEA